jgi:hypothetical protein
VKEAKTPGLSHERVPGWRPLRIPSPPHQGRVGVSPVVTGESAGTMVAAVLPNHYRPDRFVS